MKVFTIWLPMLRKDSRPKWTNAEAPLYDPRVKHYWNENRSLGEWYGDAISDKGVIAWDIYFVYDENQLLDSTPDPWVEYGATVIGEKAALKESLEPFMKKETVP